MNVLASHTMPDLLTPLLFFTLTWSAAPVLICALLGAGIGWQSIGWRQIGGAVLGLLVGWATVLPVFFLAIAMMIGYVPWLPGLIAAQMIGCFAGSWVAFRLSRVGRPAPPVLTLATLSENLNQLERIVREKFSEAGIAAGPILEMDEVQIAEVLSYEQAALLVEIRKMRSRFMRSRVVNHHDVALWAGRSTELLDRLSGTSTDDLPTHTGGDASNPYLPPGHRDTPARE